MIHEISRQTAHGGQNIASIDIGSHTVRLLVAEKHPPPVFFKPLVRERGYSRLADGFQPKGERLLHPEAMERAIDLLKDCSLTLKKYDVLHPQAISTGVVRDAANQKLFIDQIYNQTGIPIKVISGEQEALLTKLGVLHSLNIPERSSIIFDLGGGTTEFICTRSNKTTIRSLPIGAMVFTQRFFDSDPPHIERIDHLSNHIKAILRKAFPQDEKTNKYDVLIGSGGTVTTLAAMINQMGLADVTPEKLNGLKITREHIEDLFSSMKRLSYTDRLRLRGLDEDRAEVILAGTLAVLQIMQFFKAFQMTVSYSDMLEGALIQYLQGETYE